MKECYILNSNDFSRICDFKSLLRFKYQNIFKADMDSLIHRSESIIGAELLVDAPRLIEAGVPKSELAHIVCLGEVDLGCLEYAELFLGKDKIFVNIEKVSLCDVKLLKSISSSSSKLKLIGVELVVEITERDFCDSCVRIIEGLSYLKDEKVKLAKDDFEYLDYISDKISRELELYYDYIKVDVPINSLELDRFKEFMEKFGENKRIIIERVETIDQLENINLEKVWGLQGFLFCKGVSIPKMSRFY